TADAKVNSWNTSGKLGLIARYTDQTNYYWMNYDVNSQTVSILKKVAGTDTTLAQSSAITAPTTGVYHSYKFDVSGSTLKVYIDGTLEVTATDSTFTSGYGGLYDYKEQAYFDNVVVQ
ncbi:MAG: hypothetical protein K0R75_2977, partial [Paenibacillaceae bacterium]|nr:hypothetical protein [Paenibacillaceae bacterium]